MAKDDPKIPEATMTEYLPTHHRRSIRLPGYDYSNPGAYFVTIVTQARVSLFGEVAGGEMSLGLAGQCAAVIWQTLPNHFAVTLDTWVVMPNHLHGILVIHDPCKGEASGAVSTIIRTGSLPDASPLPPHGTQSGSLGAILQNYKSVTTRRINALRGTSGNPVWQRNYYEHIVRDESELDRIRQYIVENPAKWQNDQENPERSM